MVQIYHCDGRLAAAYSKYDDFLGIKGIQWSPTGQILAVGSYDEAVVLLNHLTWNPIGELEHSKNVGQPKTPFYKEIDLNTIRTGNTKWISNKPRLECVLN